MSLRPAFLMLRDSLGASARADLERALKIGLALLMMVAVVFVVVGRHGRLAALQAAVEEKAASAEKLASAEAAARAPKPVEPATAAETAAAPASPAADSALSASVPATSPNPAAADAPTPGGEKPETALRLLPRPVALDSGTFQVGAGTIRLIGVEPLAIDDACGEGSGAWPCGMKARTALRGWLRARSISCAVPPEFGRRQETVSAECRLGSEDIGLWLIENGWARASDAGRYTIVEKKARDARRGLWRENPAPGEPPAAAPQLAEPPVLPVTP